MYGIGGSVGSIFASFITEYINPKWCYVITACLGICISINGVCMPMSIEKSKQAVSKMGFCERGKKNFKEIWQGVKMKEFRKSLLFVLLMGALVPNISSYLYYYEKDVGITQFQIGMLSLGSSVAITGGSIFYSIFLSGRELRTLFIIGMFIAGIGAATLVFFTTGHNLGMSNFAFLMLTQPFAEALYNAFLHMTGSILFAKLIPPNIEASMFALTAGLQNLCNLFLANWNTVAWNAWFQISKANLEDLWKLMIVRMTMSMVPLFFIWLVPTRKQIHAVQLVITYME